MTKFLLSELPKATMPISKLLISCRGGEEIPRGGWRGGEEIPKGGWR